MIYIGQKKEYEVIEKAMNLFWKNGYEKTSMQMLEKEIGINKFSIQARFGNKHGVFIESLKCYKSKTKLVFNLFKNGFNGVEDNKQFFYESVRSSGKEDNQKGCFVTNTQNEFLEIEDSVMTEKMTSFRNILKILKI